MAENEIKNVETKVDAVATGVEKLLKSLEVHENRLAALEKAKENVNGLLGYEARNAPNEEQHVAAAFFSNILGRDVAGMGRLVKDKASFFPRSAVQKATTDYHMYTSDNASGGYAVPTSVYNELARIKEQSSVLYPKLRKVPQGTAVMTVPTLSTKPSFGTASEAGKVANTKPALGVATLTLTRRRATVVLTKEMVQDTVFGAGITNLIVQLLGEADGKDIDTCCFQDSTSPFTGLLYNTSISDVTMDESTADAGLCFDYLSEMQDIPLSASRGRCAWYMSRTVLGRLRREKDSAGQPLLAPAYQAAPSTLLGDPYYIMDNGAPTLSASTAGVSFMIYGDLQEAWMGEAGPMEIEMSNTASVTLDTTLTSAFENGLILIAGETRRSFAVVNTSAFGRLTCAT